MKDLIIDLTDLLSRLSRSPLLTGIQRVVLAIGGAALEAGASAATFDDASGTWSILPSPLVQRLLAARPPSGSAADDVAWTDTWRELRVACSSGTLPAFGPGAILITLGASWDLDALRSIRLLRRSHGLRYAAFVHDTVPIDLPELCESDTPERFRDWFYGCLATADVLIVNSEATAACVGRVCGEVDFICPPIVRCPLAAVAPSYDVPCPGAAIRALLCDPYVLFVATLEPRKNHLGVVAAWRRLLVTLGEDAPLLVFAGAEGWRAELVTRALGDPRLDGRVLVLTNVTEEDLASLYRNCLFTIYNSLWEGWGLPVTESIAYGKVPVVPAHSGLLESGANHAEYIPAAEDVATFARVLLRLVRDDDYRRARSAEVAAACLRSWPDIATGLAEDLRRSSARHDPSCFPRLNTGTAYRFANASDRRSMAHFRDAAIAEALCAAGWHKREDWGTWTAAATFAIAGRWHETDGADQHLSHDLAIYLAVRGHHDDCDLLVRTGGNLVLGTLKVPAHRDTLVRLSWPASAGDVVELIFDQSRLTDLSRSCDDRRVIGVGVTSFMIARVGDPTASCRFYESFLSSRDVAVLTA